MRLLEPQWLLFIFVGQAVLFGGYKTYSCSVCLASPASLDVIRLVTGYGSASTTFQHWGSFISVIVCRNVSRCTSMSWGAWGSGAGEGHGGCVTLQPEHDRQKRPHEGLLQRKSHTTDPRTPSPCLWPVACCGHILSVPVRRGTELPGATDIMRRHGLTQLTPGDPIGLTTCW
jgi:hypothetical protein